MTESHGVWFGFRDTETVGSIPGAAAKISSLIPSFECVLITVVDSARDLYPPTLPVAAWKKETLGRPVLAHGNALRTTGPVFLEIAQHGELFTGFDQVWFLHSPPKAAVPRGLGICAEQWALDPSFRPGADYMSLPEVAAWMEQSCAVLGLEDGIGLEYITTERDIALALEAD